MTNLCTLFALTAIPCLPPPAAGGEDPNGTDLKRYEWILANYAGDELQAAHRRLSKEWEATVNALATVLNKTDSESARYCAIERLMQMRAESAVRSLVKQIQFHYPGAADWRVPLSEYPAVLALVKIGQPAVWQILVNRMRVPATDEELRLFAAVVHGHYSFDSAVGRFHVERVIADVQKQIDGEKKPQGSPSRLATWRENLTRLLEFYDALDRGEPVLRSSERKEATEASGRSGPPEAE